MLTRDNRTPPITPRIAAISGTLLLIMFVQSILVWSPAQYLSAADNNHPIQVASVDSGPKQATGCSGSSYEVQPGDTINGVASRSETTSQRVRDCNSLSSDVVYAGQVLKLPGKVNNDQGTMPNVRVTRARPTPQTPNRYQGTNNGPSGNDQRGAGRSQRRRR
jgi:LysM repeat protein